jgi:hypothetical protein
VVAVAVANDANLLLRLNRSRGHAMAGGVGGRGALHRIVVVVVVVVVVAAAAAAAAVRNVRGGSTPQVRREELRPCVVSNGRTLGRSRQHTQ